MWYIRCTGIAVLLTTLQQDKLQGQEYFQRILNTDSRCTDNISVRYKAHQMWCSVQWGSSVKLEHITQSVLLKKVNKGDFCHETTLLQKSYSFSSQAVWAFRVWVQLLMGLGHSRPLHAWSSFPPHKPMKVYWLLPSGRETSIQSHQISGGPQIQLKMVWKFCFSPSSH